MKFKNIRKEEKSALLLVICSLRLCIEKDSNKSFLSFKMFNPAAYRGSVPFTLNEKKI